MTYGGSGKSLIDGGIHGGYTSFKVNGLESYTWSVASAESAPVPEPSIIALFGLGLVGLGFARRRRQA